MKKKVLAIQKIHDDGLDMLRARDDVELVVTQSVEESHLCEAIADAHGIVVRTALINENVIDAAKRLEVVARHGVGYDAVDVAALTRRGIPLVIATEGNAIAVAEHSLFFLLALSKCARPFDRETRNGKFGVRDTMGAVELNGRSLLIIGFGRIGTRTAALAQAFSMDVLVYDPLIDPSLVTQAGCTPVEDFRTVLSRIDALSVHCPLNDETRAMIGDDALAAMKPTAIVVNCARGGIIDEAALARALEAGRIGGAALDVFEGEPAHPAADHPLFKFDNVLVSPHIAGVSKEAARRMATQSARNVLDVFDGKVDPGVVVNREVLG